MVELVEVVWGLDIHHEGLIQTFRLGVANPVCDNGWPGLAPSGPTGAPAAILNLTCLRLWVRTLSWWCPFFLFVCLFEKERERERRLEVVGNIKHIQIGVARIRCLEGRSIHHVHVLLRLRVWTVEFPVEFFILMGVTELTEILNPPPLLS